MTTTGKQSIPSRPIPSRLLGSGLFVLAQNVAEARAGRRAPATTDAVPG